MKLGTVVYKNKIYNLDYMSSEELKDLLNQIESDNKNAIDETKKMIKR